MKIRHLLLALLIAPLSMMAQSKIAVFDSQAIFSVMPEKAAAEARLKTVSEQLQTEYRQMQAEFDKKYADYQALATDPSTPATIRDRRMQEVQQGDKKIQEFQQSASEEIAMQREALMKPLVDAIAAAVTEVGQEGGYDLILDTSRTAVAFTGPAVTDITAQVKAKLGL
ncbi:MAG: OmpH family outer membrane protein [Muribaculaceae bacterium]|nr:OmpH family outer membrane protein [Muribaculaceae bacterium]